MNSFSKTIDYDRLTGRFPSHRAKPLIGITGNFADGLLKLLPGYFRSIEAVGGVPVVIPPRRVCDEDTLALLERIDALMLSGGGDLNPLYLDLDPVPGLGAVNVERDRFELGITRLAYDRGLPILGICRGIQVLAAVFGGTLIQDLNSFHSLKPLLKHSQEAPRGVATHRVKAEKDSLVENLFGGEFCVNSFHHQAVAEPGEKFRVTARSSDGVVEAIESTEMKSVVGIQWHPECFLQDGDDSMLPLFDWFVREADAFRKAREVHKRVLTLDSHCDTPMWFAKGVDLETRDDRVLVDFHKMEEGALDASIMVSYLPQGIRTQEALKAATLEADHILDEIVRRVDKAEGVALARTPEELFCNKERGLRSVMLGVENGYALGRDLSNVRRFKDKGVVYITLCHNGDNDLCDSARHSTGEHGGLSAFGREVIREMNRIGMMVDLSHGAESSFYQALEVSQQPIVCSHSSARALCDHPRNLTDDQLKKLAEAGGVAQVTLYKGFLRLEEDGIQATVDDAVAHLLHMIEVAGVDHVGIGTDFDGDGGVPGCASASDLVLFTRRLMDKGLTLEDLRKIWGGNFLRVMQQVQAVAHS